MFKTIFIFLVSVIGLPIYAVCVAILLGLGAVFGWSYVDASVYICEYVQPLFTTLLALVFLAIAIKKLGSAFRCKSKGLAATFSILCIIYIVIVGQCIKEFIKRISEYEGMNNREIFDYVVNKLSDIGAVYPTGRLQLFTGESISYGYIMANMEVYILPVSIVLLCGLIQWRVSKRLSHNDHAIQLDE